jgi:hypothetical protein
MAENPNIEARPGASGNTLPRAGPLSHYFLPDKRETAQKNVKLKWFSAAVSL